MKKLLDKIKRFFRRIFNRRNYDDRLLQIEARLEERETEIAAIETRLNEKEQEIAIKSREIEVLKKEAEASKSKAVFDQMTYAEMLKTSSFELIEIDNIRGMELFVLKHKKSNVTLVGFVKDYAGGLTTI